MICDRTQYDVDSAVLIRNTKVQAFQQLTDDDLTTLERGTITYNTLNRIENKQAELRDVLNVAGYYISFESKIWTFQDIFNKTEFERILNNETKLRTAFSLFQETPNVPGVSFLFSDINDIEKILVDIEALIQNTAKSFTYAGEIFAGEV